MKFCKKCQKDTERHAGGKCKACEKTYQPAYRVANPEKTKAYSATYRAKNPDKVKAINAAYRAANQDKIKDSSASYRSAHLDKERARSTAWTKANPEAGRINNQNRSARKRENGGKLSKGLSGKLFKLQRGKCACCHKPLGDDFHLDHIMPIKLGGSNTDGNIQLLRAVCNAQKKAKDPIDFMQQRGFLL